MSALLASVSKADSLATRARREWLASEWVLYGRCTQCGRVRDEEDRPLLVAGRRRKNVLCLACWDLGGKR